MKTAVVVIALGLSLFAGIAAAQSSMDDRKAVEACLKSQDAKLGGKCVGIVADPCIDAASGEAAKAGACAARELAVWQALMEAALKRVTAGGFKDASRAAAQSQESWQASLRELCPIFDKTDPGMLPGAANYCRMYETAYRTLILRRLGDAVNEH